MSKSTENKRPGSERPTSAAGALDGSVPRSTSGEDVAIVCGMSDDGQGLEIIRKRGERLEAGVVRRLEQGKPIHGEVVRLKPREQAPMICDVEVELAGPAAPKAPALSGPAQVATDSYRKNWDAIYGSRKPALN